VPVDGRIVDQEADVGLFGSVHGHVGVLEQLRRVAAVLGMLNAVDLRGAYDFRHSFATWLEDAGIPARVIDELMGHEASTRGAQHLGSTMGAHYRHTTPEMATRVVMAIHDRLAVVVSVAEQVVEAQPTRVPRNVF
jgi:integrase